MNQQSMCIRYLSVCAGIEAATVAWHPLGWKPAAFAEIDAFPRRVLKHHYPEIPNHGDFTTIKGTEYGPIDLLVGGTPCQDFSVAGLRAGVAGERGNLTLEFLRLAQRVRPRWLVWENVPGIFSSTSHHVTHRDPLRADADARRLYQRVEADEAHAFACFLAGLQELGYGFAYRTLDAQFFGVPQRRRRVFVVGHLGDWRRAAAVLFEHHSLSGHPPPRREKGQRPAPTISARTKGGGGLGSDFDLDGGLISFGGNNTAGPIDVSTAVNACGTARGRMDFESETFITHSLRADGFDASEDGTGRGTPIIAIQERAISENPDAGPNGAGFRDDEQAYTLEARTIPQAIVFDTTQITSRENRSNPQPGAPSHPLTGEGHPPAIASDSKASGRNGFGVGDVSPTLRSMGHKDTHQNGGGQIAVMTLAIRGREGESNLEVREDGLANAVLTPNGGRSGMGVGAVAIGLDSQLNGEVERIGPLTIGSQSGGGQPARVASGMAVRRLTPRECERLQGFPDDYTKISEKTADGPRYKALGNSMAVPVMRWIGERIAAVEALS